MCFRIARNIFMGHSTWKKPHINKFSQYNIYMFDVFLMKYSISCIFKKHLSFLESATFSYLQLQQLYPVLFRLSFEQIFGPQTTCKALAIILWMMNGNRIKFNNGSRGKTVKSREVFIKLIQLYIFFLFGISTPLTPWRRVLCIHLGTHSKFYYSIYKSLNKFCLSKKHYCFLFQEE